jgi:Fic family protein
MMLPKLRETQLTNGVRMIMLLVVVRYIRRHLMENDKLKNLRDNQPVYNPTQKNVLYMLRESNLIEGVEGKTALTQARRAWDYMIRYDFLNNQIIKETHRILMEKQPIERKYRGDWRDVPVYIGGEAKTQPKPVIDSLMRDFCSHVNEITKTENVNHDAIHCHLQFEGVHPFIDGNGRMGRIILNWQLVKRGMTMLIYTKADVRTYYRLFASYRARELGDMWGKLKFMNAADL